MQPVEFCEDGSIGTFKDGASGAFGELGVLPCDDEARDNQLRRDDLCGICTVEVEIFPLESSIVIIDNH